MTQTALQQGSAAIPEAEHSIPPTQQSAIDESLAVLRDHAKEWTELTIPERLSILEKLRVTCADVAERWVAAACRAKGIERGSHAEGEEWLGGPVTLIRNVALLIRSLEDIHMHGRPQLPKAVRARPNGQVIAPVFPTDKYDALLFQGFEGEVWLEEDVSLGTFADHIGTFYTKPAGDGVVSLVLGAGNVASIGPMDALYKLFAEGEVVILKMNPVNEYLGPIIEDAFAELVRRGFFRIVYGGAVEGDYICNHELVETIHITGSDKTHDAIVWGLGEEGAKRKERGEPRNDRHITSELGNVTPIIVTPGVWSEKEIEFQAKNVVSSLTNNAGFNCNATRVVITHAAWPQRRAFLSAIERAFAQATARKPYYPGAAQRQAAFLEAHPDAKEFGPRGEGRVPWTFISDVDNRNTDDICFTTEAWCGVTSETALGGTDTVDYIQRAVEFANESCWGTLSCSILVHPDSMKDPRIAQAVDTAIADLRYGSVVVNHWSALSYGFVSTTWGAYPGHTLEDIRSGIGVVHNTYLLDKVQKSVIRGPFTVSPKPPWFFDHKTGHEIGRKLVQFYADTSWTKIPSLLFSAIRG